MKAVFIRSCCGVLQLRTCVLMIWVFGIFWGLYEVIDYGYRVYEDLHTTPSSNHAFHNSSTNNSSSNQRIERPHRQLYDDSAFAAIIIGILDLFLFMSLFYVTLTQKHTMRVVIFVAAVWSFVLGFLNVIAFGISLTLGFHWLESSMSLLGATLNVLFGYIILSYFKQVITIVERGLDDPGVSYHQRHDGELPEIQMDDAIDEQPILDDQDDFPMDDHEVHYRDEISYKF